MTPLFILRGIVKRILSVFAKGVFLFPIHSSRSLHKVLNMRSGIRLNLLSASSDCMDSYLQIVDSVYTFKENHKFIDNFNLYPSDDKKFISIDFKFNDSSNFISKCNYVLSFIDSLYLRYHSISHMVSNFSAHSK